MRPRLDDQHDGVDVRRGSARTARFIRSLSRDGAASGSRACRRRRTARPRSVRMPVTRWRVVCALREVMLTLLADQRVEQRRLADVRPADDRDVAAAERRRCRAVRHAAARRRRRRAYAALGRRLLGRAAARARCRGRDGQRGNPALDREGLRVRLAGDVRSTAYSGTGSRRPCSHSCSRVFGSLPSDAGSAAASAGRVDALDHRARRIEAAVEEHGAEHRLERVGEDRRPLAAAAPALALAEADRRRRARVRGRARASVSRLTRCARSRDRSPSGSVRKALGTAPRATTQLSTASPTNSSRSLWAAPWLRWVSAWCEQLGLPEGVTEAVTQGGGRHPRRWGRTAPSARRRRLELEQQAHVADQVQLACPLDAWR